MTPAMWADAVQVREAALQHAAERRQEASADKARIAALTRLQAAVKRAGLARDRLTQSPRSNALVIEDAHRLARTIEGGLQDIDDGAMKEAV